MKVNDIQQETPDCVSVSFAIPEEYQREFQFTQGQNVTLRATVDGQTLRRSYSICSSPLDQELRIAVKKLEGGVLSTYINERLAPGEEVDVLPPTGQFFTPLDPTKRKLYLAFAAGSGITPILSIIKTTLAFEPLSQFCLVYGNRSKQSIIFKEQLQSLKDRYLSRLIIHYVLSREQTDAQINQGRIDPVKCAELFMHFPRLKEADEFFLCGPEKMILSVKEWLESQHIEPRRIHFELFTVPGEQSGFTVHRKSSSQPAGLQSSVVSIRQDGIAFEFTLPFNGEPILDAALREGADLPYSCKGGVCASCRAKLIAGKVHMDANYALEPDELKAGFILTCQSHPRSAALVIDFDLRS